MFKALKIQYQINLYHSLIKCSKWFFSLVAVITSTFQVMGYFAFTL